MFASCTALVLLIEIVSYVGEKVDLQEGNVYKWSPVHFLASLSRIRKPFRTAVKQSSNYYIFSFYWTE
jgi:hypothetical protein